MFASPFPMVQADSLTKKLIHDFLIKDAEKTRILDLITADDAVFCVDSFVRYTLAAINAGDVNQIKECCRVAEQLFLLNEESIAGMLSMHFITTVFPVLEKKIPEHKQIKLLLEEELNFCFNYYLILENNWLY